MYKHFVFDIDGTLINTEYAVLHSLRDTIQTLLGQDVPTDDLYFCFSMTAEEVAKKIPFRDALSALGMWEEKLLNYFDTVRVFDGVEPMLRECGRLGIQAGVVTSETKEEYRATFLPFGLDGLLQTVVCADDTVHHKPSGEPLLKYMSLTNTEPKDLLYIGDSNGDSRCAADAGVDFALALWGTRDPKIPAKYYPKSPEDLLFIHGI